MKLSRATRLPECDARPELEVKRVAAQGHASGASGAAEGCAPNGQGAEFVLALFLYFAAALKPNSDIA